MYEQYLSRKLEVYPQSKLEKETHKTHSGNNIQMDALNKYLDPQDIKLEQLYLDPNNPRFQEYASDETPDSKITEPEVQSNALAKLSKNFGSDKLKENMKANGFLPIDRVVARRIDGAEDAYVVLEGNRRIAAAKSVKVEYEILGIQA